MKFKVPTTLRMLIWLDYRNTQLTNIKSRLNVDNSKAYLHFGSMKNEMGLNEIIHFIIGHMGE